MMRTVGVIELCCAGQVDKAKPGDRVAITGVFKAVPPRAQVCSASQSTKPLLKQNHLPLYIAWGMQGILHGIWTLS
jgi:DNA replicative helicase MCM subunit Mcm2 (Cdc46/Mcm family)